MTRESGDNEETTPSPVNDSMVPRMMFATGEEPVGIRVLTYQSSRALRRILNSLDTDE
ncbi:unnamed protein product, partial [Eruca vesicaria subsp. sativa]|nr:unnamed protein product [Eruca vesicaria subsp. sativa]CAH8364868.1 unnamed protein product [Eruca vesicaria subsp. sativa]